MYGILQLAQANQALDSVPHILQHSSSVPKARLIENTAAFCQFSVTASRSRQESYHLSSQPYTSRHALMLSLPIREVVQRYKICSEPHLV
jgi:hypothetical protein